MVSAACRLRPGLERHQTLRQAVQRSYDPLLDAERSLLERWSVFSGGFDLQSACAVAGLDAADNYIVLDQLDTLDAQVASCRRLVNPAARFLMLEKIRQFARA